MVKIEFRQSITMLATFKTLVAFLKEAESEHILPTKLILTAAMLKIKDHVMWSSILDTTLTREAVITITYAMTRTIDSATKICET